MVSSHKLSSLLLLLTTINSSSLLSSRTRTGAFRTQLSHKLLISLLTSKDLEISVIFNPSQFNHRIQALQTTSSTNQHLSLLHSL